MREIKFRVWDNKYSTMINNNKQALEIIADGIEVPNFFKPMQYTGLKDKNGVETYEGGIVKEGILTGEIKFVNGCFIVAYYGLQDVAQPLYLCTNCEVIGNIYENPELLEAT